VDNLAVKGSIRFFPAHHFPLPVSRPAGYPGYRPLPKTNFAPGSCREAFFILMLAVNIKRTAKNPAIEPAINAKVD
jgi:hypothetical protein